MNGVEMIPVVSSNIAEIGHDGNALFVRFNKGALWRYDGVSAETFEEIRNARSVGSAFNQLVKSQTMGVPVGG